MTLFAFRGVKSHEWTFYDPINVPAFHFFYPVHGLQFTVYSKPFTVENLLITDYRLPITAKLRNV
jgi:hypothetical protein